MTNDSFAQIVSTYKISFLENKLEQSVARVGEKSTLYKFFHANFSKFASITFLFSN